MESLGAQPPLLTYPQVQNALRIEFARARRYAYPLCCVLIHIDGLERLREIHGAAARDELIRHVVVRAVQAQTRSSDATGLYHDRVVLILPHTPMTGGRAVAERIRESVASQSFPVEGAPQRVTLSIGVAALQEPGTIFYDSILKAAETVLAQAIAAGGDRIEETSMAGSPPPA